MVNLDYVGEVEASPKRIKSQIMVNIIEGRHYYKSNVDTYVVVEIPYHFYGKTATRKTSTVPSYFKKFIIDLPSLISDELLRIHIIITVYESRNILLSDTVLGRTVIEISTIWSEPDKLFHNKWLTLIERGKNNLSIKGYLKCDLFVFCENKFIDDFTLSSSLDYANTQAIEINGRNVLIPSGFKMAKTHLAKYSIKLYKFEMIRHLFDGGRGWLSVDFGEASESSIKLNINETDLDWNQEYSTISLFPPLCPTITIKFISVAKPVAIKTLSMHDFIGKSGLPRFGPAFLHFTLLGTQQYFGRILMSMETELVPSEIENIKMLHTNDIVPFPHEEFRRIQILIVGVIFCVNQINKKLIKSDNMKISMDYSDYNFVPEYKAKTEFFNTQTPEYKAVSIDDNFYKLSIDENTKPCLYLVINLPVVELDAMLAMNLFSTTVNNMETYILKTLKNFKCQKSDKSKIEVVREMLIKLCVYHQRFKNLFDENKNLQKHIHVSCVNYMKLFRELCMEEIKIISNLAYNESDLLINSVYKIRDIFEKLLIQHKNRSYNGPPNIFLNLCDDKTIVSRCQIQIRNFLSSNIPEFKGKYCRKIQPWFLQETDKRDNLFDGIMETVFWVGPYLDINSELSRISGFSTNNCKNLQPCLQYTYQSHNKSLIRFKAHISQAVLSEKCYKQYGQLNLMARIIFDGHSMTTEVINSNLSPSWNVTLAFKPITFTWHKDINKECPIHAVVQLCHVQMNKGEPIENVFAYSVIRIKKTETPLYNTLNWFDILDKTEKIGNILIAIEVIEVSNELAETVGDLSVPLLKHVQPKLRVYELIVLFWGLRQLKSHLDEPFVRMFCSGSFIDSGVIKNTKSFPNFPFSTNESRILSIELPEDPCLIPPISFQLQNKHTQLGMCASQATDMFLVPRISDVAWNQLKSEHTVHSVLEIEEDDNDEKTEEKNKFQFNFNFLKKIIGCITPSCIKHNNSRTKKHINAESEDDENEFNWWTKYYGFKNLQNLKNHFERNKYENTFSKFAYKLIPYCKEPHEPSLTENYSSIKTVTIYDKELERIPEFEQFEDNIKKFKIYGYNKDDDSTKTVAILKANMCLYPKQLSADEQDISKYKKILFSNNESQIWPGLKTNKKCNVVVRVYILRAHNLHPKDIGGLSDPYVDIRFGKSHHISDYTNYVPKTLSPMFGRCYQRVVSLPECSTLKVKIMDFDRLGKNELIGETTIDIEARYYSKHRAHCGLPKHYNKNGYNRWRDRETPSEILHKLCLLYSLNPPLYTTNSVVIGTKIFKIDNETEKPDRQSLALYVLNHWQDMPAVGYHLVPEHVETRTLHHPDMPNLHQGTLEMWVDIFPKNDYIPEIVDVKPPIIELYELRVIIWSVTNVKLVDDNFFTGEKHCDIYIKGWLPGIEKQSTDIHYRSLNGDGLFNWRFKFTFPYNKTENTIVHKIEKAFSIDQEQHTFLPRLHLQIWDNDNLSLDSYIGFLTLDLWNMPRGTKSAWGCTTSDKVPRINLFKVKKTRGWWPFISTENNVNSLVGKVDAEIHIMRKLEANKIPAGFGRDEPQSLPEPKRPSPQYLKTLMGPLIYVFCGICRTNKRNFITAGVIAFSVIFVMMFFLAIPGYLVKKWLHT